MNYEKRQNLQKKIWQWYQTHSPDMPWRKTRDPYHIFISEVMLQQTQIPRVLEKYPAFLRSFPTIHTLAASSLRKILKEWHGMGYNRRSLYLKRAAEMITKNYSGIVPADVKKLESLPGIGPYSAGAIRCFAYGECKPFIETNIRRVIIHECFPEKTNVTDAEILNILEELQPKKDVRAWYWALMDYGREALHHIPNPNRKSKHYTKQSRFEGSPRYVRAKIISYLLKNKKATVQELRASLTKDPLTKKVKKKDLITTLGNLEHDRLIHKLGAIFRINT